MDNLKQNVRVLIEGFWIRRWHAMIVAWAICITGWIGVALLPDKFESEARIYVDTSTVLGPLLEKIAIDSSRASEVAVMQRTLLSRPNLEQVARATDLDLEATTPVLMEELIERLARKTRIAGQGPNLFTIGFADKDPNLAKAVVQTLLTIFVEDNLGQNRTDMESAQAFLGKQIRDYEDQLKAAEQRLAEFKTKNSGVLASMDFASRLEKAHQELATAKLEYEEAVIRRDQMQAQFSAVPQYLEVAAPTHIVVNNQERSPLESRIDELERTLDNMRLRYTEKHPDVIAALQTLDMLKQQYEEEKAAEADEPDEAGQAPTSSRIPNVLYEQIKLKLVDAESEVATLRRRVAMGESVVARIEAMAATAPQVEAQLKDLNRDYDVIKRQYEELLNRREQARMTQQAEETANVVNFRVIEPPQVPAVPSSPNRPLFVIAVLIVGLGAGVGFAILLDQLDSSFRTPDGLEDYFGIPVLGCVTQVVSEVQRKVRVVSTIAFFGALSGLLVVFAVVVLISADVAFMRNLFGGTDVLVAIQERMPGLLERLKSLPVIGGLLGDG